MALPRERILVSRGPQGSSRMRRINEPSECGDVEEKAGDGERREGKGKEEGKARWLRYHYSRAVKASHLPPAASGGSGVGLQHQDPSMR